MTKDKNKAKSCCMLVSYYEASMGCGAVVAGESGLVEVYLPFGGFSRSELAARVGDIYREAAAGNDVSEVCAGRLASFFIGEKVSFDDLPLDLNRFTLFQREVYRSVAGIPYGGVRTYAEVAAAVGRPGAARGVGQAMARNLLPVVIPCHRVLGSKGGLTGYSAPGGVASKRWLLQLEQGLSHCLSRKG